MFRRNLLRRSAKDIALRGSEWTRLLLRSSAANSTIHCDTYINIFPMLHVASVKFYDSVLEEIQSLSAQGAAATPQVPFYALLEGILSNPQQRMVDAQEYNTIYYDPTVRQQIVGACTGVSSWEPLGDRSQVGLGMKGSALYSEDIMREICNKELNLGFETIVDYNQQKASSLTEGQPADANLLHLQDAYFKPLLATLAGNSMLSADVTEPELFQGLGTEVVPLHKLPQQRVKAFREEHLANYLLHVVTRQSMLKQVEFMGKEAPAGAVPLCNIAVLWGHYHTDGILEALQAQINDINTKGTAMMTIEQGPTVYRTLTYGVPESLLTN